MSKVSPEADEKNQLNVDQELENGPLQNRCCTDILCWLIWVASLIFWIYSVSYSLGKGKPIRVLAPWDEEGSQCGYSDGLTTYSKAYFYTMLDPTYLQSGPGDYYKKVICVASCPSYSDSPSIENLKTFSELSIDCKDTTKSLTFTDSDINPTHSSPTLTGCKTFRAYKSVEFLGQYCMPSLDWVNNSAATLSEIVSKLDGVFGATNKLYEWVSDLTITYPLIIMGFVISIVLGLFYCYFLRCCAGVLTWTIIILLMIGFWVLGYVCYQQATDWQAEIDAKEAAATIGNTTANIEDEERKMYFWYVMMGAVWLTALIYTCQVLCNYQKIRLVVCIIKATARFMNENVCILLVPVINSLLAGIQIFVWIIGIVYLYSVGTVEKNPDNYPWSKMYWEDFTRYAFYFNLFFGLWVIAFFVSLNVFVTAAAAVIWYFQQGGEGQEDTKKSTKNPCVTGYKWGLGWHMGSIAFGSFILAAIWAIQIIFLYIEKKMKDAGEAKNGFIKCVFAYVHYCLAAFERLIKFLNKQAYIQIALTGKNFCRSAYAGFLVIMGHMTDFALLGIIGNGFVYLAIFLIVVGSVLTVWMIFKNTTTYDGATAQWFTLQLVGIISWVVAKACTGIMMVVSYAILQCFYVDVELQKGKNGPPRHTPGELREFVERAKKL